MGLGSGLGLGLGLGLGSGLGLGLRVRVRARVRVSPNLAEPDDQRVARAAFAVELHAWLGRGTGLG